MKQVKLDMHLHSKYSHDGLESVEDIVALAKSKNINALTITDHDSIASYKIAKQYATDGFFVIPGVEYTTTRGHVPVYFVEKHAEEDGLTKTNGKYEFEEIIDFAKKNNGLAFSAHIFKHATLPIDASPYDDVIHAVDGLEIYNGRCSILYHEANIKAQQISHLHGKGFSIGSDGHSIPEMFRAYRILEFEDHEQVTLEVIKQKICEPFGSYYAYPTPGSMISYTKLKKSMMDRNIKRICKYLLQYMYSVLRELINKKPQEAIHEYRH